MNRNALFTLAVHDPSFSTEELVINPDIFPPAGKPKIGDIVEIFNIENQKKLYLPLKTLNPVKGNVQVSISKYIATVFEFVARRDVYVRVVTADQARIDYVELSFKDQYIGRSDMWRLRLSLLQTCVYALKKISFSCVRAQVEELLLRGEKGSSGFITADTKFVFRSRSAKFIIFIQMSKEMWDFAEDGDLYFEKAINGFLKELFDKWKALGANHSFTIILFSRVLFDNCDIADIPKEFSNIHTDIDGRRYQDFYKIIINDETRTDYDSVIIQLKKEFNEYPSHIHWDPYGNNLHRPTNSTSSQGNFLESINLALNVFDKHYVDRDLNRTGQMIVVISAGTGLFEVDPQLTWTSKRRLIDNGIGCDLICLSTHPLHIVPLFIFKGSPLTGAAPPPSSIAHSTPTGYGYAHPVDAKPLFHFPYWLSISFYKVPKTFVSADEPQRFITKCKMPVAQYKEVVNKKDTVLVPTLPPFIATPKRRPQYTMAYFNSYDDAVFADSAHGDPIDADLSMASDRDRSAMYDSEDTGSEMSEADEMPINIMRKNSYTSTAEEGIPIARGSVNTSMSSSHERTKVKSMSNSTEISRFAKRNNARRKSQNPYILHGNTPHLSSNRRRWAHLWFNPNTYIFGRTDNTPTSPNWKSLCEPASLPVSTDYFPDASELNLKYQQSNYSISILPDETLYLQTEDLLKELVSQRLAQGYQVIISPEHEPTKYKICLSMGHNYHRLTWDPSEYNIQVMSYYQKRNTPIRPPILYNYSIWPHNHTSFTDTNAVFSHTYASQYSWNYVDRLISGSTTDFNSNLKYWRIQFTVIPQIPPPPSRQERDPSSAEAKDGKHAKDAKEANVKADEGKDIQPEQPPAVDPTGLNRALNALASGTTNVPDVVSPVSSPKYSRQLASSQQIPLASDAAALDQPPSSVPTTNGSNSVTNGSATSISTETEGDNSSSRSLLTASASLNSSIQEDTDSQTDGGITPALLSRQSSASSILESDSEASNQPTAHVRAHQRVASTSEVPTDVPAEQPRSAASLSQSGTHAQLNMSQGFVTPQATPIATPIATPTATPASSTPASPQVPSVSIASMRTLQRESSQPNTSRRSNILSPTARQESVSSFETSGEIKNLSEADRITNFVKFREYLSSLITKNNAQQNLTQPSNSLSPGKSEPSIKIRISGEGNDKSLIKATDVDAIIIAMSDPKTGVPLKDRKHRFKTYKHCFIGNEAVDWMILQVDVRTRAEAVEVLQRLLDAKLITSLSGSQAADGESFYKFTDDSKKKSINRQTSLLTQNLIDTAANGKVEATGLLDKAGMEKEVNKNSTARASLPNSISAAPRMEYYPLSPPMSPDVNHPTSNQPAALPKNSLHTLDSLFSPAPTILGSPVQTTWSMSSLRNFVGPIQDYFSTSEVKMEMDTGKTDRYEWLKMIHDTRFNPYVCFHFEMHWLVCTGCVVDDFVQQCVRKAKQVGLVLVQTPISKIEMPFSAPLFVPLTPPKADPDMQQYILSKFNFVPDYVSSDILQFAHSSGLAFIRVVDEGFLWITNTVGSVRNMRSVADNLQKQFIEMCDSINTRYLLAAAQHAPRRLDFDTNNNNNNNNHNNTNTSSSSNSNNNSTQNSTYNSLASSTASIPDLAPPPHDYAAASTHDAIPLSNPPSTNGAAAVANGANSTISNPPTPNITTSNPTPIPPLDQIDSYMAAASPTNW